MAAPGGPSPVRCFRCGAAGVWHAQSNQWGCDHCRQLIGGPSQVPAPFVATPPVAAAPLGPFATQPPPQCPRCWGNATWHAQIGKWGCDRCKSYLDPAVVAAAAAPNAVSDAGAKVGKFLLWLILLIALIALKVWIRTSH